MSKFTKKQVNDYADKLLIGLTDDENKMVLDEFEVIDKNINLINEIPDIENIEPMTHTLDDFVCYMRDDDIEESIEIDELLDNCDEKTDREVVVSKVVG